ncbi:MAG: AAA family ATPase [Leptothrix sp. (in: b-proteobacteria)]
MPSAFVITLLGAAGTGKTTLAVALVQALREQNLRTAHVPAPELELIDAAADAPALAAAAARQTDLTNAARHGHDCVVVNGSALQFAAACEQRFQPCTDRLSLYTEALAAQRRIDLTLLMALDLPTDASALAPGSEQRQLDRLLRAALLAGGIDWSVVAGHGPARLAAALAARQGELRRRTSTSSQRSLWRHACGRCGDPDCERHLLAR